MVVETFLGGLRCFSEDYGVHGPVLPSPRADLKNIESIRLKANAVLNQPCGRDLPTAAGDRL